MEYAKNEFIPYILSQLQHQSRLHLVWDCYVKTGSLKTAARAKRGRGTRRRVTATTTIPGNWHNFLCVDDNKQELFSFLSKEVTVAACEKVYLQGWLLLGTGPCAILQFTITM